MSDEFWKAVAIIIPAIAGSRLLSHFEHKKTEGKIDKIEISINGILQKQLDAAREEGRLEERNKK